DGTVWGWIGGGCVQPLVVREALKAIADGKPRLVRVAPSKTAEPEEGTVSYAMTCHSGGALDIYIEPILAKPQILIFGRSAVAKALCSLGKAIGYRITVMAAGAVPESFPEADTVKKEMNLSGVELGPETFIVVSTQGEQDEEALEQACGTDVPYISFVASNVKSHKLFESLAAKGIPDKRLAQIRAPAGLRLGGLLPQEIALSILAEIVQVRKTEPAHINADKNLGDNQGQVEAIDPVCGMSVQPSKANYASEYRGEKYYFCCGSCKQAFDAHPENYLATTT
ncbi:MAG: XdhC family protein, partial [Verrucomicrobia bacterium]|nr:XdhC family protein [Verrucomicrobiota bacterium]